MTLPGPSPAEVAAHQILDEAERAGIVIRLLGSLGIRLHCPGQLDFLSATRGEGGGDVDMASEGTFRTAIDGLFARLGFQADPHLAMASDYQQLYFVKATTGVGVDVYLDRLNYNHPLEFKSSLALDAPTLPVADLLLTKLQIVQFTRKDLIDVAALVLDHPLSDGIAPRVTDAIDTGRICTLLARDWGFFFTAQRNLSQVLDAIDGIPISEGEQDRLRQRLIDLSAKLEATPKTLGWRTRARIGTRVRWYQDVEDK